MLVGHLPGRPCTVPAVESRGTAHAMSEHNDSGRFSNAELALEIQRRKDFDVLCARVNSAIDVQQFVNILNFHPDRAIQSMGLWRLYCPVHGDTLFRTLVINPRRNTCHCDHTNCAAHGPSDLIDLLAKVRQTNRASAVLELIEQIEPARLTLTGEQEQLVRLFLTTASRSEA